MSFYYSTLWRKSQENGGLVGGFFTCIVVFGGSSGFGVGPDAGNAVIVIV